jgi:3-(3-hydroxy-phenyl)propionate hydroxylase
VRPRIARMLGHENFDFEWISLYKFQCRRMSKFIHGRVMFAGDAAHQVSPFGARGANSGLEDAENLAWKLDRVLRRQSPETLLDSYHTERSAAADENIRESTRSTDFMAPSSRQEARLRAAVLSLARETDFAKRMVNAGRLSIPSVYDSPLSSPDCDVWHGGPPPGASMPDAPIGGRDEGIQYLTEAFIRSGLRFTLLDFSDGRRVDAPEDVEVIRVPVGNDSSDMGGMASARFDAAPAATYLLRPDGYIAARFRHPTRSVLEAAVARAAGMN